MHNTYRILALTKHSTHSLHNSLYALLRNLYNHPQCAKLDVASLSNPANDAFFIQHSSTRLEVCKVTSHFSYEASGLQFMQATQSANINDYDIILLRLPRPLPTNFFSFLVSQYPEKQIINRPSGITETGSKAFLCQFPSLCPPLQLCTSIASIKNAAATMGIIVLKPLENYGGRGIVKVENETIYENNTPYTFAQYQAHFTSALKKGGYLAMTYLHQVHLGDKRIVLVNGKAVGASLRLPAKGSWMCNIAQGGRSVFASIDKDEMQIIETLAPILLQKGIVVAGIDTLVGNDGRRVLSEINTLSVGGLPQMAIQSGKPIVQESVQLIIDYINENIFNDTKRADRTKHNKHLTN